MTATRNAVIALGLMFLTSAAGMAQTVGSCGCEASCEGCGGCQCDNAFPGLNPQDFSHNPGCRYADGSGSLEADPICRPVAPLIQDLRERCGGCTWRFDASAMYLHRAAPTSMGLLIDPLTGGSLLDGDALQFSAKVGPRFDFVVTDCEGLGLELNYFAVDGWSATRDFANADFPAGVAQMVVDSVFTEPVTDAHIDITSVLRSSEINVRQRLGGRFDVLCGFRWIDMYDRYLATGTSTVTGNTVTQSIVTWNHLFANQVGLEGRLGPEDGSWSVVGFIKGGVALNNADASTTLSNPGNIGFLSVREDECRASGFGEAGLTACFQIDKHISVTAGYQVMYIDSIAQPVNQISRTDLIAGTAIISCGTGILYHGGNLGLDVSW